MPPRAQQIQQIEDYDLENPSPQDAVGGGGITDITDADIEDITDAQIERTADPMLQMQHRANVRAEAAAYKPGWLETLQTQGPLGLGKEMVKDFGAAAAGTTRRWAEMATGVPQLVMQTLGGKGAQVGTELIKGVTEPLISPRTTGKALTEGLIDTAALGVASRVAPSAIKAGARAIEPIRRPAPFRTQQGTNQVLAALRPNIRTAESLKATQGHFQDFIQREGRTISDSNSAAAVFKDAADDFKLTNYDQLAAEAKNVLVMHQGQPITFEQGIARRAELNKVLGRLGYYDKNPLVKSFARTSPEVRKVLDEVESLRGSLNKAVDTVTPTNTGAANILRTYADMKQVADMAAIRAEKVGLQKAIKAGEAEPLSQYVKDTAMTLATLGVKGPMIGRISNYMWRNITMRPQVDPDVLFARGAKNWAKGAKAAAQPRPTKRTPIPMTKPSPIPTVTSAEAAQARTAREASLAGQGLTPEQVAERMRTEAIPTEGQMGLGFAPPGVGAMANELPLEPGFRPMTMPNRLTQQFNRPAEPAKPPVEGQYQLPLIPPRVGNIPPTPPAQPGVRAQPVPPVQPSPMPTAAQPAGPMATSAAGKAQPVSSLDPRSGYLPPGVRFKQNAKVGWPEQEVAVYDIDVPGMELPSTVYLYPGESLAEKVAKLRGEPMQYKY